MQLRQSTLANNLLAHCLAIAGTLVAVGLRAAIDPFVMGVAPLALIYSVVAICILKLGVGPAITATLSGFFFTQLWLAPPGAGLLSRESLLGLPFYLAACGLIIGFGHVLVTTNARLRAEIRDRDRDREAHSGVDQRMRLAFESVPIGFWEWDLTTNRVHWSPELEAIHGIAPGSFGGTIEAYASDMHPDDKDAVFAQVTKELESGDEHRVEYRIILPDGAIRWVEGRGRIERDPDGKPIQLRGVCTDVTARKDAELKLARRVTEQAALYEFTNRIHRSESLDDVYDSAIEAILAAVGCDRASILLYDHTDHMRFVGWRGLSEGYRAAVEGHSPWGRDTENPEAFGISDVLTADLDEPLRNDIVREGIAALAFVPLVSDRQLIGKFMVYYDDTHEFEDEELELATTIAHQIAFAIAKKQSELLRAEIEHELRASEQRYRHLVDLLPAAMFTCEASTGRLTYYNERAARLWGRTPDLDDPNERYCGSLKIYLPDGTFVAHEDCPMARALHEGHSLRNKEIVFEREDGTCVNVLVSVDPIRDDQGTIIGAINVFLDITALKHAETALRESEQRFRTMANLTPAILWTAAPDGTITWSSDRWFEYTGTDRMDDAVCWPQVLHGDDAETCLEAWKTALAEGTDYEAEVRNRRYDGTYRWFVTRAAPRRDAEGKVVEWYGSTTDIHDRKEAERVLFEADRLKDEFLATLAHELRNPLSPIQSGIEYAQNPHADPDRARATLDIMGRQVQHLNRLVDDLLDIARIKRGTLNLQLDVCDVRDHVRTAADMARPSIEKADQSLTLNLPDEPLLVRCDPQRIVQVFGNLLMNAYKFSPNGGTIDVQCHRQGDQVVVEVLDSGNGLTAPDAERIFEPFVQVGVRTTERPVGLGVGLALAKRLVEAHEGTIDAASEGLGRGSCFTVRLPAHEVSMIGSRSRGDDPDAQFRKILVVDDNEDAADTLALLLRMDGHEVTVAYGGREALSAVRSGSPEVVLLDLGMPEMDGFEVAAQIRAERNGSSPALVALTGWGQREDIRRTDAGGFDGHLVKPATLSLLREMLVRIQSKRHPANVAKPEGDAPKHQSVQPHS